VEFHSAFYLFRFAPKEKTSEEDHVHHRKEGRKETRSLLRLIKKRGEFRFCLCDKERKKDGVIIDKWEKSATMKI
jgi:hypothetical protein